MQQWSCGAASGKDTKKNYDNLNVFLVIKFSFSSHLTILEMLLYYSPAGIAKSEYVSLGKKKIDPLKAQAQYCFFIMVLLLFIPLTDVAREERKSLI